MRGRFHMIPERRGYFCHASIFYSNVNQMLNSLSGYIPLMRMAVDAPRTELKPPRSMEVKKLNR